MSLIDHPATLEQSAAADSPGQDLLCFACGYNLLGQPEDGRCPECGVSVAETRQRIATLHAWSDPPSAKRSALVALISLGIIFGWIVCQMVLMMFILARPEAPGSLEYVMLGLMLVATLTGTLTAAVAASRLARIRAPGGRINRRLLSVSAWVLPASVVALWLFIGASYLEIADDFYWEMMVLQVIMTTLFLSAALLSVTYAGEMRRRVRLWPRAGGLAMILTAAWLALLLSFAGNLTTVAAGLAETATGWFEPRLQMAMNVVAAIGALLFLAGMVVLAGSLVLVMRRRLPEAPLSLPSRPR